MISNFSLKIRGRSKSKRSRSLRRFWFPFYLFLLILSVTDSNLNKGLRLCYLVKTNFVTSFSIANYAGLLYMIPSTEMGLVSLYYFLFFLIFLALAMLWCSIYGFSSCYFSFTSFSPLFSSNSLYCLSISSFISSLWSLIFLSWLVSIF